ncbi:serine peptidase [Aspergillus phoenicis ATCC 13157]|uniref:Serine peptidase n=1 Tax=Aspergillus phoenicis ATCC 13157 TaxID=1353007 RepID=A0A370PJR3_ASPPH|nr:serine peptidase [Aspergillus phoenicis ATCC 13157]
MAIIEINGNTLDPQGQRPVLRAMNLESADATKSDFILIQSVEPLSNQQEEELEKLGVDIQEYTSQNTYLCGYKKTDLHPIRNLPFVSWANVYLDLFVIGSTLKSSAATRGLLSFPSVPKGRVPQTVDIIVHAGVDPKSDAVLSEIAAAAHADPAALATGSTKIRLKVQSQYLESLAAIDKVKSILPVYAARLFNNRATKILGTPFEGPNSTQYEGEGQVVAVADTGFDQGSTTETHPAFSGRVRKLYALGDRDGNSDDPDGHGTHVCGSVLGDGFSATMGGRIRGAAPKANLVMQSLLDQKNGLRGIPNDLGELFWPPYRDDGARIHTNSWGSSSPGGWQLGYDPSGREIDTFIWKNKNMVILFAAGNDGIDADTNGIIDPQQIGAQAAAKNCITVGASENNRPEIRISYGDQWPSGPLTNDLMADNPGGMAAFSSRGPTCNQRVKPEIVAPGTAILSARSRRLLRPNDDFGTSADPEWWFLAGTSMATPLVAGCVAVLRETLIKNKTKDPSAALIKALLINGAIELPGQYVPSEAGPSPNSNSGYGRVNLPNSVILPSQSDGGYLEGRPLSQGMKEEKIVHIPAGRGGSDSSSAVSGHVLKVTLVWTDPPGPNLQNDLDLIVMDEIGTEKHGNMGDRPDFDRSNNVEQVVWTNLPPGDVKLVVRAYHIFNRAFAQPYALCWSIDRRLK